jgi:hypothetical protein
LFYYLKTSFYKFYRTKTEDTKDYWPYGKPGPGVGPVRTNDAQNNENFEPNLNVYPKSNKSKKAIDEYNKIKETLAAIAEAEKQIKQEQQGMERAQQLNSNFLNQKHQDQSKLPAAMRTSIKFGDVVYDEDIKKTKELERKKWLHELEEQKREKLMQNNSHDQNDGYENSSRDLLKKAKGSSMANYFSNQSNSLTNLNYSQPTVNERNDEEKNFVRTRNLLDPAQIEDMERKRKLALEHKKEIDAQVAEKRRIQLLEEEIQTLNSLKAESEAKQISNSHLMNQEMKRLNPQFKNFNNILNNKSQGKDTMASILQGDAKNEPDSNSSRSAVTETRAHEIHRKMQEAELAAAEEKHKRLLKRLQKGGHDTRQLEKKFAELKARLTGNSSVIMDANNYETQRNTYGMSVMTDYESKLENEKKMLEKKLLNNFVDSNSNKENNNQYEQSNESKLKQIFKLLREDTNGLPAELSEEHLRLLLKSVKTDQNEQRNNNDYASNLTNNVQNSKSKQVKEKALKYQQEQQQKQEQKQKLKNDEKPIWNYKNKEGKVAKTNSMKDPFYQERLRFMEERKKKRFEQQQHPNNFNSRETENLREMSKKQSFDNGYQNYDSYMNDDLNNEYSNRTRLVEPSGRQSSSSTISNMSSHSQLNNQGKPTESIMNLLTKNLATNTIYEEDEDMYLNNQKSNKNHPSNHRSTNNQLSSSYEDMNHQNGFVPFMRTNEFLDPTHAGSPVPPSRESSAIKRDREKARQV